MSLGGPNGVRAYPVGEASGDTGHLFTAELRYIFSQFQLFGADLTASAFIDHGEVHTFEDPPPADPTAANNKRSISGYGLGLSLGREGNLLVRLNVAKPADGETPISDPNSAIRGFGSMRLNGSINGVDAVARAY